MEICPFSKQPCDKPKVIHINICINGKTFDGQCCHQCANQMAPVPLMPNLFAPATPVVLLHNLAKLEIMEKEFIPTENCSGCGSSLSEIKAKGRFGCKECYITYKEQIHNLLPHIQAGAKTHVGKRPKKSISYLKIEMQKAIEEERYEDAAKLRDRIKELDQVTQRNNIEAPN